MSLVAHRSNGKGGPETAPVDSALAGQKKQSRSATALRSLN